MFTPDDAGALVVVSVQQQGVGGFEWLNLKSICKLIMQVLKFDAQMMGVSFYKHSQVLFCLVVELCNSLKFMT